MKEKNITINDLATAIEDLAISVKEGFDGVSKSMKTGFERVDKRLTALERGQEDIKLKLGNVAHNDKMRNRRNNIIN